MLGRLARAIYRRRRLTLTLVVLVVAIAFAIGGPVLSLLSSGSSDFEDSSSESVQARDQLERATGADPEIGLIALIRPGTPVQTAAARAKVDEVAGALRSDPAVARVFTAFNTHNAAFVSKDGRSTYVVASFKPVPDKKQTDAAKRLERRFAHRSDIVLGGPVEASREIDDQIGKDLARAEMFGIPILIILSILFFRGFIAALLPFAVGLVSIGCTFFLLRVTNEVVPLSVFSINLVTGLGLGLAIDYSLFIVSRYREELARAGPGPDALARTLSTAGRTVAFSALTVAAAMAALFAFPQRFLYSMAFGGVFVSLLSAVAALVFLPALLAVLGTRVNALSPGWLRRSAEGTARGERGAWYSIADWVMRHAVPVAVLTSTLLILLGLPFLGIRFTGVDAGVLPKTSASREVQDALARGFSENRTSPVYVALDGAAPADPRVGRLARELRALPHVAAVTAPQGLGAGVTRLDVYSDQRALADASQRLVADVRSQPTPLKVLVGGEAAAYKDQQASFQARLPLALLFVCLTTGFLLFLMTGSVILPLKTLILNVLSLSATLGFLVLVFQDGRFESLLDYTTQRALNASQPILVGAVAFALSTDYAVFLLTRIKEARDRGAGDTEAVAIGIERTGRIVTAAALLLAVAIGAFVTSKIVLIKQLGLGIAFAVLLDATIVRALLVPSLMKLLGPWNWWAPAPLRRLHDRIGLRESDEAVE
jgi:uncharacterized membrane protein YdfJ with MMPL/SSD domain